jgi:hypothetical protein
MYKPILTVLVRHLGEALAHHRELASSSFLHEKACESTDFCLCNYSPELSSKKGLIIPNSNNLDVVAAEGISQYDHT